MKKMSLILILLFAFCSLQLPVYSQAPVGRKKAVMIIAHKGFQDDEFAQPKKVLQENGIEVTVASSGLSRATGMNGMKVKPDILVDNIKVNNFDAVVFIGGSGATQYINDPVAHKLAKDAIRANRIVGAICIAPVTLAKAGILKGKRATVWPSEGSQLKANGAKYTGRPVEKDGNIITASGPKAAKAFGQALVKALYR